MPSIPTYERRVRAGGEPQAVIQTNPGAASAGLEAVGRAATSIGDTVVRGLERDARVEEQRQEDQAALAASNALSAGEEHWHQRATELKQGYMVGQPDLREQAKPEFDRWRAEQRKALPTEKSRAWFDASAERLRARLYTGLFDHQDKATTDKVAADLAVGLANDYQTLAREGRGRFDDVVGRRLEAVGAQSRIPEAKRIELGAKIKREAADAVETGEMRRAPAAWLREVTKPAPSATVLAAPASADDQQRLDDIQFKAESRGEHIDPKTGELTTSSKNAKGISQVIPETGVTPGYGVAPLRDQSEAEYRRFGRDYRNAMLREYDGDLTKALAAYNAGPGRVNQLVREHGEQWLAHAPKETQDYVAKITKEYGGAAVTVPVADAGDKGTEVNANAPATFALLPYERQHQLIEEARRLTRADEAQQRATADRLLADAAKMHADGKADPFNFGPEYFDRAYGADGPRRFTEYKAGQAMANDVGGFATMTPSQIEATLKASAPVATEGYAGADARQGIRIAAARQVLEQRAKDPVAFAITNGLTRSQPIDMAKPDSLAAELNQRVGTARMMSEQYSTPLRVLTNGEATQMGAALRLLPTQQKLAYLEQVRLGLLGDGAAFNAAMQQIAADSPVTALAGNILVKERDVTLAGGWFNVDTVIQPRNVAALLLEGEAILNPSKTDKKEDGRGAKYPLPKDSDLEGAFNAYAGSAFRGAAADYAQTLQAFKAYYAGAAARAGTLSNELDEKLANQAAAAVTGGVIDYNGAGQVRKPWGMSDTAFKDRIAVAYDGAMRAQGLKGGPQDNLGAYGLVTVSEGRYVLTNGAGAVVGPKGPVVVDIMQPLVRQLAAQHHHTGAQ